jgi:hypothetical protein
MIELYHNDMSVCAQKVRFALAERKLNGRAGKVSPENARPGEKGAQLAEHH